MLKKKKGTRVPLDVSKPSTESVLFTERCINELIWMGLYYYCSDGLKRVVRVLGLWWKPGSYRDSLVTGHETKSKQQTIFYHEARPTRPWNI